MHIARGLIRPVAWNVQGGGGPMLESKDMGNEGLRPMSI